MSPCIAVAVVFALVSVSLAQFGLPAGLPSPFLWVRGDAGIVTSSGAVTQWNDIRANGAGLDRIGSGNEITTENSAQLNNRPVVRFNGRGNTGRTLLSRTKLVGRPLWIFAAMRMTQVGFNNGRLVTADIWETNGPFGGTEEFIMGYWPNNENVWLYPPSWHYSTGVPATTNPSIYTGHGSATSNQLWKNGAPVWNEGGNAISNIRLQLGGLGKDNPQQISDGQIAEVIMFGDELNTAQYRAVNCYLSERYAIALTGQPACTTYCCQQVTDVCNSIQSRCNVLSAAAAILHDLCIPGGEFCDAYNAANALVGSCTRVYNSCHTLNTAC